jgi:hypothetical protein
MKPAIAVLVVLAALLFTPVAHADGTTIDGENIILGSETLNFVIQGPIPGDFLPDASAPFSTFQMIGGFDCFSIAACIAEGAAFQIGIFDLSIELGGPNVDLFPAVGVYSATLVDVTCAFPSPCFDGVGGGFVEGLGPSADGQIVITAAPEPGILLLLLVGLAGIAWAMKFSPVWRRTVSSVIS